MYKFMHFSLPVVLHMLAAVMSRLRDLRVVAMAEVVKEDKRLTHDSDSCGDYHVMGIKSPSRSFHGSCICHLLSFDKRQPRPRH